MGWLTTLGAIFLVNNWLGNRQKRQWLYGSNVALSFLLLGATGRYRLLLILPSPAQFACALVVGWLLFDISLGITRLSVAEALRWLSPRRVLSVCERPILHDLWRYAVICTYEEAIWRGTIPYLLGDSLPVAVIVALLFALGHLPGRCVNVAQAVDIVCFSLTLGLWFWRTGSLWPVILIHLLRNTLIVGYRRLKTDGCR